MVKIEDLLFWILMALIVGVAIWKIIGSPTDTAALISLALFIAGSEILIWRAIFGIDKRTSIGFIRIKNELNNNRKDVTEIKTDIKEIKNITLKRG